MPLDSHAASLSHTGLTATTGTGVGSGSGSEMSSTGGSVANASGGAYGGGIGSNAWLTSSMVASRTAMLPAYRTSDQGELARRYVHGCGPGAALGLGALADQDGRSARVGVVGACTSPPVLKLDDRVVQPPGGARHRLHGHARALALEQVERGLASVGDQPRLGVPLLLAEFEILLGPRRVLLELCGRRVGRAQHVHDLGLGSLQAVAGQVAHRLGQRGQPVLGLVDDIRHR